MKKSKNILKITKNIIVLKHCTKHFLTVIGKRCKKSIRLNLKIDFSENEKLLYITDISLKQISNKHKKKKKANQGNQLALIKQLFLETSFTLFCKLKLIGIGYRILSVPNSQNKLLMFKLGYSHAVYFKTPNNLQTVTFKFNKLFITGYSYNKIFNFSSLIRSYKLPEPYKGKGILYENEKIVLKEGKKI